MRIEQEQVTVEYVQKIVDLSDILINIAEAFTDAAWYALGLANAALETG